MKSYFTYIGQINKVNIKIFPVIFIDKTIDVLAKKFLRLI